MKISLGWGVLLDYSGRTDERLYKTEAQARWGAEDYPRQQLTRVVEVFCEVPDEEGNK